MSATSKWLRDVGSNFGSEGGDAQAFYDVADELERLLDEIDRLRPTEAEVNAIRLGELAYPGLRITDNGKWVDVWAALRGLLERHGTGDTPPPHATPPQGSVPGEGGVPDSGNWKEPVAWWLRGTEYDTGCEYEYVSLVRESADAAAKEGGTVTPLYAHPQHTLTDAELEAIAWVCFGKDGKKYATLRGLLERLK